MKKNGIFLVTILLTLFFWQWAYFVLKGHYSGLTEVKAELASLQDSYRRANVRTEVVQFQFDLFKQQIAKMIPNVIDDLAPEMQKQGRGLASVLQKPPEEFLVLAQFEAAIEELKGLFEKRAYPKVIRKGKQLLELNPISPSLVTVYFMLAESYFQTNEFDSCLNIAEQMIQLFPDDEKTGYVLLRVGIFLKEKNRLEEARNMFSLVTHAFAKQKNLKSQAEKLLAHLGAVE